MWKKANLCNRTKTSLELELRDSHVGGFTPLVTGGHLPLSSTPSNAHPVDDVALLGFVAESPRLVRSSRPHSAVDGRQLPVLPAADPQQESEQVRLLLTPQLLQVLVGAHFYSQREKWSLSEVTERL